MSTNWGRSYTFENIHNPNQREQLNYRRIEIAPGTVPTGLYAYAVCSKHGWSPGRRRLTHAQSIGFRYHGLGIVSEAVPEW
jgi:hypothetical protein